MPRYSMSTDWESSWIGLIPAAGKATRLGVLPSSKELLPVGYKPAADGTPRPKPVSEYLLDQFRRAGCRRAFFVLRRGKLDIANYYGNGVPVKMDIGYLFTDRPYGPSYTIDQATPFVQGANVLLGFPDILTEPCDAHAQAARKLEEGNADIILGVFPAQQEDGSDFIEIDINGRVIRLIPKEAQPEWHDSFLTWIFAAWRPSFTAFLHQEVGRLVALAEKTKRDIPEWPIGSVIAAAMETGLAVESVSFPRGRFLDIGVPERLARAYRFPGIWDGVSRTPREKEC